jgi:acyl-CoA synthetase (AMP-forming)/AMP-acid ligase II
MKLPITSNLVHSFLQRTAEALPSAHRLADETDCQSIAEGWLRIGLRPGDLVLLALPNGKELLKQFFGVILAQGVPALVTPMVPAARLRELAEEMGARAIGSLRLPASDLGAERVETLGPMSIAVFPAKPQPAAAAGEVVLLTSGTSGFSSGCVFDLEALLLNGQRHAESIGQAADDVVLVSLPLNFSFALVAQALASLVCGNRLVISGPPFNAAGYQQNLRDFEVTVTSLTPVLVRTLLQGDADFLHLPRVVSVGGDSLAPELVASLISRRPEKEVYLTYGLTQAGPRVSTLAAHAQPPKRYGSVGLPLAGTTVFLRETADSKGLKQLFVTSQTVMKRQIGRVEGRPNHEPVAPQTVATGDAFEQDEQGYLYFKGRLCDFINRKGEKISMAAVRRVAAQLPGVASARTRVIKHDDGSEDFDLELQLEASAMNQSIGHAADHAAGDMHDRKRQLHALLRRADMPRNIFLAPANEAAAHRYK